MTSEELSWAHTRAEWDQAWSQARHLETMSGQWLAFYFTALLGVVAIAGPRLDTSPASLVLIAILALVLELLAFAVLLALVRLGTVHHYYDNIIFAIRDATISSPPAAVDLSAHRTPPPPLRGRLVATTKGVSRLVLVVGIAISVIVLAADLVGALAVPDTTVATVLACATALAMGLGLAVYAGWLMRSPEDVSVGTSTHERTTLRGVK